MKKYRKTISLLAAVLMCLSVLCFPVSAQSASDEHLVVTIYNEQNGLPTGEANVITQTSDGYIWIGSYGGLIRYDGSTFRNYSLEASGISSSSIRSLYESSDGKLWIGTNDAGVFVLDKDIFTKIECTDENSFLCIRDFAEDSDGTMYVASNSGIGVIKDGKLTAFETEGISGNTFYTIACDGYDRLWATTDLDAGIVLDTSGNITKMIEPSELGLDSGFYSVANDALGNICIGTQAQVARIAFPSDALDAKSFDVNVYDTGSVTTHNALVVTDTGDILVCGLTGFGIISANVFTALGADENAISVNYCEKDYEGNYWLASSSYGVIKYTKGCFDHTNDNSGLEDTTVNAITKSGDLFYIGLDDGLAVFDSNWEPVETEIAEKLKGLRIRHLISDDSGRIWIAMYSNDPIICYDPADGSTIAFNADNGLNSTRGRTLLLLSDGAIAAGTQNGVAIIRNDTVAEFYGAEDGLVISSALSLLESSDGALLAGSDGGGIYRIKDGNVTNHSFDEGLSEGVVLRMAKDSDDPTAYFISAGSSLYYWKDNSFRKLSNFAKGPGSIFDLYDIDGKLWLMQNNGILSVNKSELLSGVSAETVEHGFTHGLTGSLNANTWNYISDNGTIYIATRKGVDTFDFHEAKNDMPKGIINSITVDGTIYEHPENLSLNSDAQRITIDFAALTFTGTTRLKIAYKLEGFDSLETLLADEANLNVSYTNLPGGKYTFTIRMIDPEGTEADQIIQIPITKARKLYEQPLFWILITVIVICISAGLAMIFARIKINSIRERQNEYKRIMHQSLSTFAKTIDAKDPYTKGHSTRVAEYSREIARRMGFSEDEQERIYYIALMHDIGKIGIPDTILNKPDALTEEERRIIQTHVNIGGDILKDFTALEGISQGARYHHERFDGNGYCEQKKGDEIPLVARIIGIADTYDAMSSDRCYRKALSEEIILNELYKGIGTQFDPDIVPYMLEMIEDGTAPSQSER